MSDAQKKLKEMAKIEHDLHYITDPVVKKELLDEFYTKAGEVITEVGIDQSYTPTGTTAANLIGKMKFEL